MRILHVIESLQPSRGGPPQVCIHLANEQAKNHEISVLAYTCGAEKTEPALDPQVQYLEVSDPGILEKLTGGNAARVASQHIDSVDVVHIHNVWESALTAIASLARSRNKPYIVTPHGMLDPWCMSQKRLKKKTALVCGRRKMLEHAKFMHVLNAEEEQGIRKLALKNRCEIVPNGVPLELIDPYLDRSQFESRYPQLANKPFVLFLARLHYKKGLDILAQTVKTFFERFPDWQLVVAGPDGGMQDAFSQQITASGLEDRTHVIGPIYGNLKYSLLAASEVFCLPSRQEGFSVAILEAMAASKPVVISDHCHFGEVADSQSGFVDELDPARIADSLGQLAGSDSLRKSMGENARKLVEEKYTWSAVNERLIEIYLA